MQNFPAAPWPTALKLTSAFASLVLAGVGYFAWRVVPPAGLAHGVGTAVACVPPLIALGALLFVVAGYEVDGQQLRVRRLLWATTIPLGRLKRAWKDPAVLKGSIRVVGNGGLFSFSGTFSSRRLGRYRIFGTDWKRSVVLKSDRVVVVTPADPDAFLEHIRLLYPGLQGPEIQGEEIGRVRG